MKPVEIWECDALALDTDSKLLCLGGTGILLCTHLDFFNADASIPLIGTRTDKLGSAGYYATTISGLCGQFGSCPVFVNQDLTCSGIDEVVSGTVSLANYKVKLPAPTGSTGVSCENCDLYINAIMAELQKKYPKAEWFYSPF